MRTQTQLRNFFSNLRELGKLSGTIKRAVEKNRERYKRNRNNPSRIFGRITLDCALRDKLWDSLRGRKTELYGCEFSSKIKKPELETRTTFPYQGRHRNHDRNEHYILIPGFIQYANSNSLIFAVYSFSKKRKIFVAKKAPRGMEFKLDYLGLKLVSKKNSADEAHIAFFKTPEKTIKKAADEIRNLKKTRAQQKKDDRINKKTKKLLEKSEKKVFFSHAKAVGLCDIGTKEFMRMHDLQDGMMIKDLMKFAKYDKRVEAVCKKALVS